MTTTEAIRTARREVTMHRQGDGWCVSYPYNGKIWWESAETSHAVAREWVRRLRIERALGMLGCDDDVLYRALESGDRFEAAVREAIRQ